jgi:acetylcholinesterase
VQKNIASFGGDPTKITLFGQSAGGVAVDAYNLAYPEDPIVTGLIMNSGTALLPTFSRDTTHSGFSFVARSLGCSGEKELECMRAVRWEKIEAFLKDHQDGGKAPPISFVPVKDDVTFFNDPAGRAKQGKLSKKVSRLLP